MERFEDPADPLNSAKYHTGTPCIEPGCDRPAGTHWSHLWCQPCNAERMRRIGATLERLVGEMTSPDPPDKAPVNDCRAETVRNPTH